MPYGKRSLISGNLLPHLQHLLLLHLPWHRFHPSLHLNIFITQTTVLPATQRNTQLHHPLQRHHTMTIMVFNVHFHSPEETTAR